MKIKARQRIIIFSLTLFLFGFLISCQQQSSKNTELSKDVFERCIDSAHQIASNKGIYASFNFLDSITKNSKLSQEAKFNWLSFKFGHYFNSLNNLDSAFIIADSLVKILDSDENLLQNNPKFSVAYFHFADVLYAKEDFKEAYKYYLKGLQLAVVNKDTCTQTAHLIRFSMSLYRQERYLDAAHYFLKSIEFSKHCEPNFTRDFRIQELLDNTALSYYEAKVWDSSKLYFYKTLSFIDSITNLYPNKFKALNIAKGVAMGNYASLLVDINQSDSVAYLFDESIRLTSEGKDLTLVCLYNKIKLANYYIEQHQLIEIPQRIAEIDKYFVQHQNDIDLLERIENLKWNYYKAIGDNNNAFKHLLIWYKLKDSYFQRWKNLKYDNMLEGIRDAQTDVELNISMHKRDSQLKLIVALAIIVLMTAFGILWQQKLSRKLKNSLFESKTLLKDLELEKMQQQILVQQLQQKDKEKDIFLNGILHDLFTPLTGLRLQLELAELQAQKHINISEKIDSAILSIDDMIRICTDLLEFRKSGTVQLHFSQTRIKHLMQEVVQMVDHKIKKKQQRIKSSIAPNTPELIHLDAEKTKRIIINLLVNASKFSAIGAEIELALSFIESNLQIVVRDEGVGMTKEVADKLFDFKDKISQKGTAGEQSFGLGLFICQQIVAAHNGKIDIETEIAKGTTIKVTLPITEA